MSSMVVMRTLNRIPTVDEQPIMVARDAFRSMHMSDTTGYSMISAGTFPLNVRRVGGRWMVNTADLRRYLGFDNG